jgi:hypothetical protein
MDQGLHPNIYLYGLKSISTLDKIMDDLKEFVEKWPFITIASFSEDEYVGIVQNRDAHVTSFYDYNLIKTLELQKKFLELGEIWWWESNRQIPINIFLKQDFIVFRPILKTFVSKEFSVISGPCVSLNELNQKRSKRRSIQLVKKL